MANLDVSVYDCQVASFSLDGVTGSFYIGFMRYPEWICGIGQALLKKEEGEDMRTFFKSQKGFILIDALVGMVILSVALMALAVAYRQATITTVTARNYNNAVYIAQQTAEKLKENDGKKAVDANWTIANTPTTINNVAYVVETTIADVNLLKQATITVSWFNNTKNISIVNYYYLHP